MLQAVDPPNSAYENLSGYFRGGATEARQPVGGVPSSRTPSARIATRPGQEPPAGKTPIPTSSQKPGNREGNQRIPYARFMYTWPADTARPRELIDGDVLFVHRSTGAMGSGTNRLVKSTGIPQLNALLSESTPGTTTLDLAGPGIGRRIKEVRVRDAYGAYLSVHHTGDAALASYYWRIYQQQLAAPEVTDLKDVDVYRDWQAVITLMEWTVDGVLISADDDELDVETPKDARHDGILLNVCVQGPTLVRNSKWHLERATVDRELIRKGIGTESSAWGLQVIDEGVLVQDKVFCGLFVREVTDGPDGTGKLLHYAFYYKLFSSRQAYAMAILNGEAGRAGFLDLRRTNPAPFAQGPSEQEFRRLVNVWHVGKVMDNHAVQGNDPHITLNVCIERWPMWRNFADAAGGPPPPDRTDVNWLQREYGYQIGRSLVATLKGPTVVDPATQQVVLQAQAAAQKVADVDFQKAYTDLKLVNEAFGGVGVKSIDEAMKRLEGWVKQNDLSIAPPAGSAAFFKAVFDIVNGSSVSKVLDNLKRDVYDPAEQVAIELFTVVKDKPAAKGLLTSAERALVDDASKLLQLIDTFSGLKDRINRISKANGGAVADALGV